MTALPDFLAGLDDAAPTIPAYWRDQSGSALVPAVMAYCGGWRLTGTQVGLIRCYLRQWVAAPSLLGPGIADLRARVDGLADQAALDAWIADAAALGIDPL